MHPLFKITTLTFFLAIAALSESCTNGNSQTSPKTDAISVIESLPKLLDRHENLRYGKEWEDIQNFYAKQRDALVKDPTAKEPLLNLAECFIQEARVTGEHPHYYPAALQVLEEMLKKPFKMDDPKDADLKFRALGAKASVLLSQHEFAAALETGKEALKLNAYNSGIYGVLVDANVELGNYEEAVKMADKMVEIRPDLRSYSRVSYLREIHGDVEGSIAAMKMAAEAGYPGTDQVAWARLTLGNLYAQYGKPKEAELEYQNILAVRPDYPFALGALADLEIEKKNYAKAEELLNKAAAIIPEVGFFESLAKVYQATGRKAEAQATIEKVLAMMQEDVDSGHKMDMEFANVHLTLANNPEKALEYALKEHKVRPENIDVNGMLAKIYFTMGNTEKGKEHLQKALRTGSKNPEFGGLRG